MTCTFVFFPETASAADGTPNNEHRSPSDLLAQQVTIHRDEWGVAHLFGDTDESTLFGAGYAQAEDYFWQLEDTTIQAIGRYAELRGKDGLKTDLLVRSFELARRSEADFAKYHRKAESFYKLSPPE